MRKSGLGSTRSRSKYVIQITARLNFHSSSKFSFNRILVVERLVGAAALASKFTTQFKPNPCMTTHVTTTHLNLGQRVGHERDERVDEDDDGDDVVDGVQRVARRLGQHVSRRVEAALRLEGRRTRVAHHQVDGVRVSVAEHVPEERLQCRPVPANFCKTPLLDQVKRLRQS